MSGGNLDPEAMFGRALEGLAPSPGSRAGWDPLTVDELRVELPQYAIGALIGRGGMGAVYQGRQTSLDRPVAIKILPPAIGGDDDLLFAERFQQEARAMAKFKHPGIVAVHESGETPGGLLYFVMELVEGTDVGALLARQGRLAPAEAIRIAGKVSEALAYAHDRGVVHRDIKPSNVILESDGTVKVADFGLAKLTLQDSGFTRSDLALGSPDFAAPECSQPGIVPDARADLFSLGVMLYQMLTGKLPRGRFDPPSRIVEGLDPRMDAIIDKALRTDRDQRYSSAAELSAELSRLALPAPVRGRLRFWIAAGAAAVATVALLVWLDGAPASSPVVAGPPEVIGSPDPWLPVELGSAKLLDAGEGWMLRTQDMDYTAVLSEKQLGRWVCNGGVRARRRIPPGQFRDILLSIRHSYDVRHIEFHYHAADAGGSECRFMIKENRLDTLPPNPTQAEKLAAMVLLVEMPIPHPGSDISVELVAVGRTVTARLNGHSISCNLETEVNAGTLMMRRSAAVPFRDLQYLNLDGLPEAEARKVAGFDGPPDPGGPPSKRELLKEAETFGGSSYAWVTRSCSWVEAEAIARQAGGWLVTVKSTAEQQWLLNHPGKWFIGGRRRAHAADPTAKSGFSWFGEPITFDGWMPGEPGRAASPADEPFMCLSSGKGPGGWCDVPAKDGSVEGFIIEWHTKTAAAPDRTPQSAPTR